MQTNIRTLKNGLRIITSPRPESHSVTLGIWVKTGSACETAAENGISHFLEHMVFKGTPSRTSLQIDEEIENAGGQSNAYTSRECTAFYAKMLKEDTELALDVLADIFRNASFPEAEMQKEKEVVVQEIKQTIDTPDDIIFDYLQSQAFPNQALGRTILGPQEGVRGFSVADLQNYRRKHYAASNTVVCAVGNIEHEAFVNMVQKRFADFQPTPDFNKDSQQYQGGYFAEPRDIEQGHVLIGFEGVKYSADTYYPCTILSTILGGGSTSRLFQEIREKRGLVYSTYSFSNAHSGSGLFGIYAGTGNNELPALIPVICDEVKKISTDKVSAEELQRAKTQLKANMLMSLESSSATTEILARQMLIFDRIIPVEEMVEKIERVTQEDVRNIAEHIFSGTPSYTLVGDISNHPSYEFLQNNIRF